MLWCFLVLLPMFILYICMAVAILNVAGFFIELQEEQNI